MSERSNFSSQALPITERLEKRLNESLTEVGETHKLIGQGEGVVEAYSKKLGSRILAIDNDSSSMRLHGVLLEQKVPVLSGIFLDDIGILLVPEGSRKLSGFLPALNRDPVGHRKIFFKLGQLLRDIQLINLGLPSPTVLDKVGFAPKEEGEGGGLFLVPPYDFDEPMPLERELEQLEFEMELSEAVTETAREALLTHVEDGWNAIG